MRFSFFTIKIWESFLNSRRMSQNNSKSMLFCLMASYPISKDFMALVPVTVIDYMNGDSCSLFYCFIQPENVYCQM